MELLKINITKEHEKDIEFNTSKFLEDNGYKLSEISYMLSNKNYEVKYISDRFKNGDKVVYRKDNNDTWKFGIFNDCININNSGYNMYSIIGVEHLQEQCIPLNVNTWGLLGTNKSYIE